MTIAMKKTHFLKTCLYLFAAVLFASCGKSVAHYIPDLGAQWKDLASADHDVYFFNPVEPSAFKSDFNGNETLNYSTVYTFSGYYINTKIQFTFTSGPKIGTSYSGTISGAGSNTTITLDAPTGKIVLTR